MPPRPSDNSPTLIELKEKIARQLEELASLDGTVLRRKNQDIKDMIRYYNHLTDMVEERRMRIHTFSLQLLAISAAIFAVLVSGSAGIGPGDFVFWPLVDSLGVLILASLISGLLYEAQSAFRYPFLKFEQYGNKWKWFYYGNEEILRIDRRPIFSTREPAKTSEPYLAGLSRFVSNYKDEDLPREITDNIQQLYLLQVHNYYKNRFYLQLTEVWKWALAGVILVAGVACGIGVLQWLSRTILAP